MDRPLLEPERPRRPARLGRDRELDVGRESRGRHVDRLLEVRPVEGVGLVEERQHVELAPDQEPLERDLPAGNEVLDQDLLPPLAELRRLRGLEDRRDPAERRDERGGVVRPDHAAAAGEDRRLEDARIGHAVGRGLGIVGDVEQREARRPHAGPCERLAHPVLVAGRGDGVERARPETEALGDGGPDDRGPVVDGNHGVDPVAPRELGHRLRRLGGVVEVERQEVVRQRGLEDVRPLRRHHELDVELRRRGDEVLRAIRRRRDQEEQAQHASPTAGARAGRETRARARTPGRSGDEAGQAFDGA